MKSQTDKRIFPFDLGGQKELGGANPATIGFGGMPMEYRVNQGDLSKAIGVRPVIASLSYVVLGNDEPHEVRIETYEQQVDAADFKGGVEVPEQRWHQVLFSRRRVTHVHGSALSIPVSDRGNPFGLRITTKGRGGPSMVIVDWQWSAWSGGAARWRSGR